MIDRCKPADGTAPWTHHWIGPRGGDSEPWLWTPAGDWLRGCETHTVDAMVAKQWVYCGPCERPHVVADLRMRLTAAEVMRGVVVPFAAPASTL